MKQQMCFQHSNMGGGGARGIKSQHSSSERFSFDGKGLWGACQSESATYRRNDGFVKASTGQKGSNKKYTLNLRLLQKIFWYRGNFRNISKGKMNIHQYISSIVYLKQYE